LKIVIFRSLQLLAMIILFSGLFLGIREKNISLELNALVIGSVIFYGAHILLEKYK